jgi:signal transduction histidine kinase
MESVTSTILSAQASSPPPAPMAVLIIESDPLVRDALELHFRQHPSIGIVVVDAVDGAFTQLEQLRFDAVILDASIPRAEEVIVHLEQKHPAPAVLLTISLADAANLEHFPRSAGLLALMKPTPLVILERGIELAIAYRRTLERNKSLEHTYHEQSIKLEQLHHECDTLRQQLARLNQRFRFAIHDLQNPLSNLMALLGDLQRHTTNLPPRVSESLELSYQSTQLLQTYIEDMLNALQLDSTETITFGPVDVAHLVRSVAWRFTPNADRKNIWINVLAPPTLPVIYADESLLSKALDNLVSNAIKFTPQGERSLSKSKSVGICCSSECAIQDLG